MRYKIIPKKDFEFLVDGKDPVDALANFAANMDSDMGLYFESVPDAEETEPGWKIEKRVSAAEVFPTCELGELSLTSGCVCITDPCYNDDAWCRLNNVPVVPGEYNCVVRFSDEGEWGIRVAGIGIYRSTRVREEMDFDGVGALIGDIGVDAGLAGIFQDKPDFTDEQWKDFCDEIYEGDAWLVNGKDMRGFFSYSGFGDGMYAVYGHPHNGTGPAYDGIEIIFVEDVD